MSDYETCPKCGGDGKKITVKQYGADRGFFHLCTTCNEEWPFYSDVVTVGGTSLRDLLGEEAFTHPEEYNKLMSESDAARVLGLTGGEFLAQKQIWKVQARCACQIGMAFVSLIRKTQETDQHGKR